MKRKKALITGITGQDGAYLAELLLEKGYEVHGIQRRSSVSNTVRLDSFHQLDKITLHQGDLVDPGSLFQILETVSPDEIYNLAAQSHVAVSFESPEYSAQVNALGPLRILEALRILGAHRSCRFYQASTSELFGQVKEIPQKETTPFYPRSPYAVAKLYAYWITVNYRESYGMYACNGILFNHESPLRGETFVTRKITRSLTRVALGLEKCLYLGNLDALRDWGHARDYVEMQWLILQQSKPNDFVIATGIQHSVREFVEKCAFTLGIEIAWEGEGLNEKAIVKSVQNPSEFSIHPGMTIAAVSPQFFRPSEVETLLGDASKADKLLGWKPKISFEKLVEEMTLSDLELAKKEARKELIYASYS